MTSTIKLKKTGYEDIDNLLLEAHKLIEEGNELQKEIEVAVKIIPNKSFISPFKKANKRSKSKL